MPADEVKQLQDLLSRLRVLHREFYDLLSGSDGKIKRNAFTDSDLVDFGFLCRESETLLDDWRKDAKARKELAGKILCLRVTERSLAKDINEDTVKGTLATAKTDVALDAKLPEFGTDEYTTFMDHLGVPKETADKGLVKVSWDQVGKYVSDLVAEGKPVPPGITKTWPKYSAVFTRLRSTK